MTLPRHASFALVVSSFVVACAPPPEVRIGTYNAGLARGFVAHVEERAPRIVEDFPASEIDVACVQEYWDDADFDALASRVSATHPHRFRRPAEVEMGATASCEAGVLDPVEACVVANCADVTSAELTDCALDNCGMQLDALPSDCFTCLAANVALGDLALIRSICESAGGGRYAYGGSFGTGILSRHPLAETDSLLLTSTTNRRAVLYARIPDTAIGEIHFFCTHLTANLSSVPYTGEAAGWPEEQAAQIERLVAWTREKAPSGRVVIAGDLNNGPALPGITGELEANFAMWSAAGLRSPYTQQPDVACTFCDDNRLNLGTMGGEGGLIDHVLIGGGLRAGTGRRFLDATIEIVVDGMSTTSAYSDHYGLVVPLRLE
jgi:endonuclease/exonuclease/phosphatase family metal-dependent hydrolase